MNNTVLRIISGLLAIGALVVGILAYQLSQAPSGGTGVQASAPTEPLVPAAVAAKAIKAGQMIIAADVAVKGVKVPPPNHFADVQPILGRIPVRDIPAGTPLTPEMFAADSFAYLVKPGERAVGIQVDEVTSVGGFVRPGDHVDVLAYVAAPSDDQKKLVGAASVVVEDARLLSIGDASKLDDAPTPAKQAGVSDVLVKESGVKEKIGVQQTRLNLKSAVLAVPTASVTKLMMAASAGSLRLSLRPPAMFEPNDSLAGGDAPKKSTSPPPTTQSELVLKRKDDNDGVVIQEGSKEHGLNSRGSFY